MPRTARALVGGYCYHVINRGNNQSQIFHDEFDYAAFINLMCDAQARTEIQILALCLMPNHVHFALRPHRASDLSRWTHWLFTTHVRHYHGKYSTSGRVWQDRFKAFIVQEDDHLLTVLRYVERNALRAGLVSRAEDWRWGSLKWRTSGSSKLTLTESPVPLPHNWIDYVNAPLTTAEQDELQRCVKRQMPYGADLWVQQMAGRLNIESCLRSRGRRALTRSFTT